MAAPILYNHFSERVQAIFHSGISSAALMDITLNLLFNPFKFGNADQQSVFVASTSRTAEPGDILTKKS